MIKNKKIIDIISSLLQNRRFFVEIDGKQSRWRIQKNGLPQGSVLAPTLFNIYTNDIPEFNDIRRFLYADDLCLATQSKNFDVIEKRLTEALQCLSKYYQKWSLNPNPGKTKVCCFHLNNHQASRELNIVWDGKLLENEPFPVYLGVTFDRTLAFKVHVDKLRKKVSSRANLIGQLANSSWGADPATLRTSTLALCYSTAEYCAAAWSRSSHAHKVDPMLNRACRTITGTLKATPLSALYRTAGIAPPDIRRDTISRVERHKQLNDERHPLHSHQEVVRRLRSRKSFMTVSELTGVTPETHRRRVWIEREAANANAALPLPNEGIPTGHGLSRKDWVTLNRARAKLGKTGDNLLKWGLTNSSVCTCGEELQTINHILRECTDSIPCTDEDLRLSNDAALRWLERWSGKI